VNDSRAIEPEPGTDPRLGSRRRERSTDTDRFSGLVPVQFDGTGSALEPLPFAVIDVETTGLRPRHDRVIEIAVVRCASDGQPISEWSTLVDPGRDPGPTRVHGIAASDLIGAPTFTDALAALRSHLEGAVIVAHNLSFDAAFIAHEFRRSGAEPHRGLGLCTLELARTTLSGEEGYSLAACARALGIAQPLAHRALADTRVTAGVLQALLQQLAGADSTPPVLRLPNPRI
jgi:DNA polymerase III epsilon subunit family exonuclease